MNAPKPGENLPKRPPRRRYISARTELLLRYAFPGKIPALVIAEALEEKARREGRQLPPKPGRQP